MEEPIPEKAADAEISQEAKIEPQVKNEDDLIPAESLTSSTHLYSTRSKDKLSEAENKSLLKQKQNNVIVQPRLKPLPFKKEDLFLKSKSLTKSAAGRYNDIEFYHFEDHPFNRRGFKYKPCHPNPLFSSNLFSTTDMEPFTVRPSYFDRSQGILFSSEMNCVTTSQGWRSVRANCGIREGKYYMEFDIVNSQNGSGHVRLGLARKEASLEAPVGFDGYGYGLRDIHGQKITLSRPKNFMNNEGFKSGDVIGILIELPSLTEHRNAVEDFIKNKLRSRKSDSIEEKGSHKKRKKAKAHHDENALQDNEAFLAFNNISRDQIPIRYKNALFYEQYEYTPTRKMEHLLNPVTVFGEKAILEKTGGQEESNSLPRIPNSKIVVYKNGVEIGTMFENLYSFLPTNEENEEADISLNTKQQQNPNYKNTDDGSLGYYPMLSVFLGGIVGLNPGPDFKFPVSQNPDVKPLSSRYDEVVIEEWYWDLIDEIEAEYLDSFDVQ
ncbi:uncharacterized protein PRCAT00000352001 [Priceomyces carsonii]|uniref:uncharacterized protein n=1 Tax=Priceomyces carsonii TaxID=28549 RepID=UPI002ED7932B|nr:unnamed protein product [Priceomyces carsonii]